MCPNTIRISDTTLRDGAQTPEVHVGIAEKVQIAQALEAVGVDVIEAGFPASSPGDAQAVRAVAEVVKQAEVMALSRCVAEDIRTAAAALAPADPGRCCTWSLAYPMCISSKSCARAGARRLR